ncbi:iron chelate uptake ABC transporter family permease subunit [Rhizobium beringeri]
MLAVAGSILQRLTGNEMASPEVLGISAGATFGVAIALLPSLQGFPANLHLPWQVRSACLSSSSPAPGDRRSLPSESCLRALP